MKVLAAILLISATMAYADVNVTQGKISANVTSEPLRQVVDVLKQKTEIRFSVEEDVAGQMVSANFQDLPVAAAIKKLLEGTGINYAVLGDANGDPETVFIGNSERPGSPGGSAPNPAMSMPARGVVTPVQPLPPQMNPPVQPPQTPVDQKTPQQRPPGGNVPTGGGFVPEIKTDPQEQTKPQQDNQEQDEENDQPNL